MPPKLELEPLTMSASRIDFSAEFGGRDAAHAVLPHFKALKAASKGGLLHGFPLPELHYILRVDGEISQYGVAPAADFEIDPDGEFIAVDIGVTVTDRRQVRNVVCDALKASVDPLSKLVAARGLVVDSQAVREGILALIARYDDELRSQGEP